MAGPNVVPIYTKNGRVNSVLVTAANTSSQGGGTIATDIFLVATADTTNGSRFGFVRFFATATAPTSTTATVGRVFLSTQSAGATTSANTYLIGEVQLPITAADNTVNVTNFFDVPIDIIVPPNMSVLVTNHAAPAANSAWRVTLMDSGDF